jgi:hypothetical protein
LDVIIAFGAWPPVAVAQLWIVRRLMRDDNYSTLSNPHMKTHRVQGTLWMAICGFSGILYLWMLLHGVIFHPKIFSSPRLFSATLLCLLYLAGAMAGISLFRGAWWARRFVGLITVLTVVATIATFVAYRSLPGLYYIVSAFEIISFVLLFSPRHEPVA